MILKKSAIIKVRKMADMKQAGMTPNTNALSEAARQKIGTTVRLNPPTAN